jgi:trans-aconitate 2-methyltransferase
MATRYTFGDGDLAVRRLALVARLYGPSSRALLARAAPPAPAVALDLGCGPGHTTRLVAEVCRPGRVLGLDSSDRYLDAARAATGAPAGVVSYARHDVTRVPLLGAPAGLIYARLLLAHLPDPLGLVARWRTQLARGGVLVLEEVEAIDAPPGVLADYERLVTALVATEGGTMAVGPELGAALGGECVDVPVDEADAGHMFALNLATWGDDAVARGLATAAEVERLAAGLAALARGPRGAATVRWVLRQVSAGPA